MLEEKISAFIREHQLFSPEEKILLTVSGGEDSVVMANIFRQLKFNYAIAHCNFKLRGEESDADEEFVRKLANKHKVDFFVRSFETRKFAEEKKISMQMAARELRYDWFEKIRSENNFSYIATAHHAQDSVETVLLNFIRGTGILGYRGMQPKSGFLIRPLLGTDKEEIHRYAAEHKIIFREDSSNQSSYYTRNKIRNEILPLMEQINPSFQKSVRESQHYLRQAVSALEKYLEEKKSSLTEEKDGKLFISVEKLKREDENFRALFIHHLTKNVFSSAQSAQALSLLYAQTGTQISSGKTILLKDREHLILYESEMKEEKIIEIHSDISKVQINSSAALHIQKLGAENFCIHPDRNHAFLDLRKLKFPLTLRLWKAGDKFMPLGMQNFRKVSDFLIDEKISLADKENTYVLFSGEQIAWVVGHRIDERFKVNGSTKVIFTIENCNSSLLFKKDNIS